VGPVSSSTSLVLGRAHVLVAPGASVPPDTLSEVALGVEVAARAVDAVWGTSWPRSITVVVGAAADLGRGSEGETATAALSAAAVTVDGPAADGVGTSHVVIDQAVWATLSAAGRRVVLTHELVHVATDSVHESLPRWLEEGLADEVGWLGSGVPVGVAAREALVAVSAQGPPTTLPSDSDLDLAAPGAAAAYGESYVAARLLALTYGQQALVDVYRGTETALAGTTPARPVTADQALDAALLTVTGSGLDAFVAAWRAELVRLAAATA
jgi:hypothetical protein